MSRPPLEDFAQMRNRLFNDALLWICLASVLGVALSLARIVVFGLQPVMLLHLVVLAALWSLWLGKDRLPYLQRVLGLLLMAWLVTYAGLLQFGPAAISGMYAILFAFIAFLFLEQRLAWQLIVGNSVCLMLVAWAASRHWLEFNLDYLAYSHQPLIWLNYIWNLTAYAVIFALISSRMVRGLLERELVVRELAERQNKIAANVPGVIYQFLMRADGSMCFPYASEGTVRLFGLDPEALKENAAPVFALTHPDDLDRMRQAITTSARNLEPRQEVFRMVHPQRSIVWLERTSTPERLANGDTLWHGFMQDVTDLKLVQQHLAATLENTPNVAVQWYDLAGRVLYWNHASELIYGWTATEALGKTLDQLLLSEARAREFQATIERVSSSGSVVGPSECVTQHRDGSVRMISSTLFSIPGESTPIFVCIDLDITEQKRAEGSLRASEALFRLLVEASPLPIAVVRGTEQSMVVVNRRFIETFGYTGNDLPDIDSWWLLAYPEVGYRETLKAEWYRRIAVATRTGGVAAMEALATCRNGRQLAIETHATIAGEYAVMVLSDLTLQKQSESELLRAKASAEAASHAKSAFLTSMSHELRTPLNAIIGFAQMLDMGVPTPLEPSQQLAIGHILGSGRHLLRLINEVLDLARIESDKLDLAIVSVSLNTMLQEVLVMTRSLAEARGILIRQDCRADILVHADAGRVRQILLNLLSNAVKYNRVDGMVVLHCQNKGDVVRISVEDTGPGIPEAQRAHLFQPFQRLGAERTTTEGTGIGLVVSRKLAEAMDGRIGFESEEGIGSVFWLELPAAGAFRADAAATGV